MGRMGHVPIIRGTQRPAHVRVRRARRIRDPSLVGHPRVGRLVDRYRAHARPLRLRMARPGQRRNRHASGDAAGSHHRSLWLVVRVFNDGLRGRPGRDAAAPARISVAADSPTSLFLAFPSNRASNASSVGGAAQCVQRSRVEQWPARRDGTAARASLSRARHGPPHLARNAGAIVSEQSSVPSLCWPRGAILPRVLSLRSSGPH